MVLNGYAHMQNEIARNDSARALWNIGIRFQSNETFQLAQRLKKRIRFFLLSDAFHNVNARDAERIRLDYPFHPVNPCLVKPL